MIWPLSGAGGLWAAHGVAALLALAAALQGDGDAYGSARLSAL